MTQEDWSGTGETSQTSNAGSLSENSWGDSAIGEASSVESAGGVVRIGFNRNAFRKFDCVPRKAASARRKRIDHGVSRGAASV